MAPPSHRSLLTLRSMVHEALAKFDRIYALQEDGRVFETPEELWSEWLPFTAPSFRATTFLKRGSNTPDYAFLMHRISMKSQSQFRFVYLVEGESCQQTAAESI